MPIRSKTSTAVILALTGLATPAFAQEGACGTAGTGGAWIGGDEASSDVATAETYLEQMALVLGGGEYVSLFSLSEGADVRIEAQGRGAGDPIIDVLDSSGSAILSDDDSGGNGAARAETYLEAGTYCMSLRSYEGGPMTAFVRISKDEYEPLTDGIAETLANRDGATGSCSSAVPMGTVGDSVSAPVNETPFWSFTLDAATAVSITAQNETADPVLTLYDADENHIADNDDFDGLNSRIDIAEPLAAGTYCIGLEALNDGDVPITVSLNTYDPAAANLALVAQGQAAPPLDGSVVVTELGPLESRMRHDVQATEAAVWFSTEISAPGLMLVEAIGTGETDPWIVIFDDLGREIGVNDDHGDGLDSLLTVRVSPGSYLIGVRQIAETPGLVRLLLERYVRAQ